MSILQKIEALPIDKQKQVEEYIDFLLSKSQTSTLPPGISGKEFVERFAGCMPVEIVEEMEKAINDPEFGCGRVDDE